MSKYKIVGNFMPRLMLTKMSVKKTYLENTEKITLCASALDREVVHSTARPYFNLMINHKDI